MIYFNYRSELNSTMTLVEWMIFKDLKLVKSCQLVIPTHKKIKILLLSCPLNTFRKPLQRRVENISRTSFLPKQDKKLKQPSNNKSKSDPPKVDDEIVTEAMVVYSQATVVWQDGTIESGISSRHLYPIHHLDEHVNE